MNNGQVAYTVDILDKGVIHVPGGMEQDSARFYYTTQNST